MLTALSYFEEEKPYIERFKDFIEAHPNCFERTCKGHITGSVWLVDHSMKMALLTHHKKLNLWIQLGGHADGDPDIKNVAFKEAQEESGIADLLWLLPEIFDIDIHAIPGPCAYHYDIRYLLQAPIDAELIISDESYDLAWIDLEKVHTYAKERSVLRMAEKFREKASLL